jgi:hypothetical protein
MPSAPTAIAIDAKNIIAIRMVGCMSSIALCEIDFRFFWGRDIVRCLRLEAPEGSGLVGDLGFI